MNPSRRRTRAPVDRFSVLLGCCAVLLGTGAAFWYALNDLTLAHYDAKAHLVVSRRILDSLTPGWEQIGAVWLPLPHLLNMLPVQIDLFYRTGAFAVALSVLSHAVAAASIAALVMALTASRAGAALAAAVYAMNPSVLYLQSTPMTEPMLFGLVALQILLVTRWVLEDSRMPAIRPAIGWVAVAACLTRYEAWPITAASMIASAFAFWRRGDRAADVLRVHARLALYPALTVLGFMLFSRMTIGEWFVSGGFFVPDESLRGQPSAVVAKIVEGTEMITGSWLFRVASIATPVIGLLALASPGRSPMLVPLALLASLALPASAYLSGHPFRMRYEIALVLGCAVATGLAVGMLRRAAPITAAVIFLVVLLEQGPFNQNAPMIREARLDRNLQARQRVTACLEDRYRGGTIMISMGSLGHYMHELSKAGFFVHDFLHEGNGPIWDSAFTRGPAPLVKWVLVEEEAEGGDAIALRQRQFPRLLEGYERVCDGGGVALYQRKLVTEVPHRSVR